MLPSHAINQFLGITTGTRTFVDTLQPILEHATPYRTVAIPVAPVRAFGGNGVAGNSADLARLGTSRGHEVR